MASVRQRGKARTWYALFRDGAGKLVERSCKTGDRKKALELAEKWEAAARPAAGSKVFENARKVIAELYRKHVGSEAGRMTFRAWRARWLEAKRGECAASSLANYEHATRLFEQWLDARGLGERDMIEISKMDIEDFRNANRERVCAATVNALLKVLKMVFRQARLDHVTVDDVCDGVKTLRAAGAEKARRGVFSAGQFAALFAACDAAELPPGAGAEWKSMIVHGYYTAQRLKDLAMMREDQIDVAAGLVRFKTGKTSQVVLVPMAEPFREWLMERSAGDEARAHVHPLLAATVLRTKTRSASQLSGQFARILAAAGLREKADSHAKRLQGRSAKRKFHDLSFHSLRHTMNSDLMNEGVERAVAMDIVGHKSVVMSEIYTKFSSETKRAAVGKLRDLWAGK